MISAQSLNALYRAPGALPASEPARPWLAVVTCMDGRVVPDRSLGVGARDVFVVRNAGGSVSNDALRSLIVACEVKGVEEIVVIEHTDCAMVAMSDQQIRDAVRADLGVDATLVEFLAIDDQDGCVRSDVALLRSSPYIPGNVVVTGFVCDTDTGMLRLVEGDAGSRLPAAAMAPGAAAAAPVRARGGARFSLLPGVELL